MRGQASGKIERRQVFWRCGGPHIAKMTHGAVVFFCELFYSLGLLHKHTGGKIMGVAWMGMGIEEALGNNKWNSTTLGAFAPSSFFFEIKKMRVCV